MKKTAKRILLGIFLVLAIVLLFVGYLILVKSVLKTMTPIETKEIINNIFCVKDTYVNLFLIKDSDHYITVDGGNDLNIVSEELKKLNIEPEKIVAVLLTHSDADHVAAIKYFKNAKIYFSKQEEQMINGGKQRFLFTHNKIYNKEYSLIEDQQIFNIGNIKIQGILTPGHTPGSMCYLINDKYLFTGDALSLKAGKINEFIKLINMDSETAYESINKITQIPEAEYIFTSHFGYTDNFKNAIKDWAIEKTEK